MERKEKKPGRKGVHINPGLTVSLPKYYCRPFERCLAAKEPEVIDSEVLPKDRARLWSKVTMETLASYSR
jgi:hypothetical protein